MRIGLLAVTTMLAVLVSDAVVRSAVADGMDRRPKKVVVPYQSDCGYYGCRSRCPDRYSCSSLYGAYGPWGGAAYYSRYSGWFYR